MRAIPRFELRDVDRRWGGRSALERISLTVEPGERLALVGPSGAGKTTLLRLMMGALRPSAGVVAVDGVSIERMPAAALRAHRQRCGLVDQGALVIPELSVHGNVIAGRAALMPWWRVLVSALWSVDKPVVRALLGEVGLADRQWDRAGALSGGQRQRVAIARALAVQPTVLLADEPTAALDPTTAAEVIDLMAREAQRIDATLVISTHRVSQVLHAVDRVIGLRDGRVAFDERAAALTDAALDALYEGSRERR